MSITRPSRLLLFCCAAFAGDFAADLRRGLDTLWAAPRSTDDMPRLEVCNGFNENALSQRWRAERRSELDGGAATHVAQGRHPRPGVAFRDAPIARIRPADS